MDYKNLFLRFATSLFLIFFLALTILKFEKYLGFFFIIIYFILFIELFINFRSNYKVLSLSIVYLIFSLLSLQLYFYYYFDKNIFIFFIFIIILFDTFSYFFGRFFGKKKLLPNISPNKTYFGFYGGIIFTVIISLIYNSYFQIFENFIGIIFILLIVFSSFIGDIVESSFKRKLNIKNSSSVLPGHGGIFDRMDSFIMSIIVFYLLNYFMFI